MYKIVILWMTVFAFCLFFCSCGESDKQRKERVRASQISDSLALKVATLPTLDCLPVFIAADKGMYASNGVEVKIIPFNAQIDCEQALLNKQVECTVTDIFRAERIKAKDPGAAYITTTGAYWQLISNRKARITEIRHLSEKMVAMTRYSATDYLVNVALDSVRTENNVFRIQINDVNVRLSMLQNNAMDAMVLTEPQATTARLAGNPVLMDSRQKSIFPGAFIAAGGLNDEHRKKQLETFTKVYNMACDSINKYGIQHYADIIKRYCQTDDATVKALPKMLFEHAAQPKASDLARTKNVKWRTN